MHLRNFEIDREVVLEGSKLTDQPLSRKQISLLCIYPPGFGGVSVRQGWGFYAQARTAAGARLPGSAEKGWPRGSDVGLRTAEW